ncbi:hypothetical protein [Arthrobacter cavernae]|uniref:Uncharacterized protein n=1 Tax=Arthrobacter cavernae TaxID=2817681 RepID=A0A939HLF7_9MICC|nr:hypothetical protein [Arthrobacter cavernae]MBO1269510.1 hypothetical protein [Arthrobacter cavernae]
MTTSLRRKRGTAKDNVQLVTSVPLEDKELVFEIGRKAGMSVSEAMEVVLKHIRTEIQSDGLPAWFDREQLQGALPIAKAS